jgi:membrane protein required for colicin V production
MHWVDLLIIAIIAWFTFRAFANGLIRETVTLAALVLGIVAAGAYYDELSRDTAFLIEDETTRNLAAFVALFGGVVVLGQLLSIVLRRVAAVLMLGPIDRVGGGVFGFAKAVALVQVALIALAVFPPATSVASAVEQSTLAALFLNDVPLVEMALPEEFANPMAQLEHWHEAFREVQAAQPPGA